MMRKPSRVLLTAFGVLSGLGWMNHSAHAAKTPRSIEKETLALSKVLKPISDDDWKTIAGEKINQQYQVVRGDSLYEISRRLFGDGKYWPKLWALNNSSIGNAHLIYPGNALIFIPGTGSSLPGVAVEGGNPTSAAPIGTATADSGGAAPAHSDASHGYVRSQEWRKLPPQDWEQIDLKQATNADQYGFDRSDRQNTNYKSGLDIPAITSTEKLEGVGVIHSSYHFGRFTSIGHTVLIDADNGELQKGKTYAVVSRRPDRTGGFFTSRRGYVYPINGRIKIVGNQENLVVAEITSAMGFMERGDIIIEDPGRLGNLDPEAAPSEIEGEVVVSTYAASYSTGQFKIAFINRGSADGVKPRNVFRVFDDFDPYDDRRISEGDHRVQGNLLVVHTSEEFSTVIVIDSNHPITDGSRTVLLTNINDLKTKVWNIDKNVDTGIHRDSPTDEGLDSGEVQGKPSAKEKDPGEDDKADEVEILDKDHSDKIGTEDEKDLESLENMNEGEKTPPDAEKPPEAATEKTDNLDEFNEKPADTSLEPPKPGSGEAGAPEKAPDAFDDLLNE